MCESLLCEHDDGLARYVRFLMKTYPSKAFLHSYATCVSDFGDCQLPGPKLYKIVLTCSCCTEKYVNEFLRKHDEFLARYIRFRMKMIYPTAFLILRPPSWRIWCDCQVIRQKSYKLVLTCIFCAEKCVNDFCVNMTFFLARYVRFRMKMIPPTVFLHP